jgi:hypothetical protein
MIFLMISEWEETIRSSKDVVFHGYDNYSQSIT